MQSAAAPSLTVGLQCSRPAAGRSAGPAGCRAPAGRVPGPSRRDSLRHALKELLPVVPPQGRPRPPGVIPVGHWLRSLTAGGPGHGPGRPSLTRRESWSPCRSAGLRLGAGVFPLLYTAAAVTVPREHGARACFNLLHPKSQFRPEPFNHPRAPSGSILRKKP